MTQGIVSIIRGFKLNRGPCCLISTDLNGIGWLSDRFLHAINGTLNDILEIGDGLVFEPYNAAIRVIIDDDPDINLVTLVEKYRLEWRLGILSLREAADKMLGLAAAKGACHNYFGIESDLLEELIVSVDEYTRDDVIGMVID